MRSICLYFQVHQPFRLKTYRFFNIGDDHHYYDDFQNRSIIRRVAEKCYTPANKLMLSLIQEYGSAFKISYAISGTVPEQLQHYAPEVIRSFKDLADTGNVEFLAETYAHSLASLNNTDEFSRQVTLHSDTIEKLFGKRPTTFRNSELIFSDKIGEMIHGMGYTTMITEGAKHILGWKSPNFMYCSSVNPKLKLLLRNFRLSDDISFRFSNHDWSEWPLTTEKFVGWLNQVDPLDQVVNIFINYETLGERQWKETGIFDFFKSLPKAVFSKSNFTFNTPSELTEELQPVGPIQVPFPISWADEERDLTSWLGNELQDEAFGKLYSIGEKVKNCTDPSIRRDWQLLQTTDHFYYMCTKWFSDGTIHKYFNPYPSPYEAFINYMNVLSDFILRVEKGLIPEAEEPVKKKVRLKANSAKSTVAKKKPALTKKKVVNSVKETEFLSIADLPDKKIKEVLKSIGYETVAYALQGSDRAILEKVGKNMGKVILKKFTELMEKSDSVKAADLAKFRKKLELEVKSKL